MRLLHGEGEPALFESRDHGEGARCRTNELPPAVSRVLADIECAGGTRCHSTDRGVTNAQRAVTRQWLRTWTNRSIATGNACCASGPCSTTRHDERAHHRSYQSGYEHPSQLVTIPRRLRTLAKALSATSVTHSALPHRQSCRCLPMKESIHAPSTQSPERPRKQSRLTTDLAWTMLIAPVASAFERTTGRTIGRPTRQRALTN